MKTLVDERIALCKANIAFCNEGSEHHEFAFKKALERRRDLCLMNYTCPSGR